MTVTIVQIPQRFMLVNRLSATDAGIRLLPFAAVMAFTSVVLSISMAKSRVPAVYTLLFGALVEVAGIAGLSQASSEVEIESSQYGYQILAGIGIGIFNVILLMMTPHIVEKKNLGQYFFFEELCKFLPISMKLTMTLAVGNGAINQFRILGGSLGLSIVACATGSSLRAKLLDVLSPTQVAIILDRTDRIISLPHESQARVREIFGDIYNTQMYILIGIAAAQALGALLAWQKKAIVLKR